MLLDTHVVLWLLEDDERLGARARGGITRAGAVHVSAVSLWEIAIKSRLGRLVVPDDLPSRVESAGLQWLPVRPRHAWSGRAVEGLPHHDPFDRMLVAQAVAESMPFVTTDRAILGADVDGLHVVDART